MDSGKDRKTAFRIFKQLLSFGLEKFIYNKLYKDGQDEHTLISYDRLNKQIVYLNVYDPDEKTYESIYPFLQNEIREGQEETINIVDDRMLIEFGNSTAKFYLQSVLKEILSHKKRLSGIEDIATDDNFTFIKQSLEYLEEYFTDKYTDLLESPLLGASNNGKTVEAYKKIQWLGNSNQLVFLLRDLRSGFPDKKPLLSATDEQIKALLINNFRDKENHDFDQNGTIDKYLQESSPKAPPKNKRIKTDKYYLDKE
ncbi:hypothetical protein J2T02_000298 [Chitinophaga terrae (ex Kim and Jung 2007)]|uniref:hypothetical protein n=1 Tax=Chitinophaga terrae (ex Kim and Jung 2007) TaxID=408074 RepID=UPI00277DF5BE|nr:hypothetical protein [Chitinophaga terrae (ex Kim and Jung 2007)]MDQ0105215.1 hypothetical protein [Chitinophaga terrae (ex Kim and Jung 2007)]